MNANQREIEWNGENKLYKDYGLAEIEWQIFTFKYYVVVICGWYSLNAKSRKLSGHEWFGSQEAIVLCQFGILVVFCDCS